MKFVCQKEDLMQGLSVASKASATRSPQAEGINFFPSWPPALSTRSMRYGFISVPPLAMAAVIMV